MNTEQEQTSGSTVPIKTISIELRPVFPSEVASVSTLTFEGDEYGGAHNYRCIPCEGFKDGETKYVEPGPNGAAEICVDFVRKFEDGNVIPGLQSEQLLIILLDRHEKLNARFPSDQHEMFRQGLMMALEACEIRVSERMKRGVMGELKK